MVAALTSRSFGRRMFNVQVLSMCRLLLRLDILRMPLRARIAACWLADGAIACDSGDSASDAEAAACGLSACCCAGDGMLRGLSFGLNEGAPKSLNNGRICKHGSTFATTATQSTSHAPTWGPNQNGGQGKGWCQTEASD